MKGAGNTLFKNTSEVKKTAQWAYQLPVNTDYLSYLLSHNCMYVLTLCSDCKQSWTRAFHRYELFSCWPVWRKVALSFPRCCPPAAPCSVGTAHRGARGTFGCRAPGDAPCPARLDWASGAQSEAGYWHSPTGGGSRRSSWTVSGRPRWRLPSHCLRRFELSIWKKGRGQQRLLQKPRCTTENLRFELWLD